MRHLADAASGGIEVQRQVVDSMDFDERHGVRTWQLEQGANCDSRNQEHPWRTPTRNAVTQGFTGSKRFHRLASWWSPSSGPPAANRTQSAKRRWAGECAYHAAQRTMHPALHAGRRQSPRPGVAGCRLVVDAGNLGFLHQRFDVAHISASQLVTFARCPEQWRRRYIEGDIIPPGIAALRGSGVHKGAETAMRSKIETHANMRPAEVVDIAVAGFDARYEADGYRKADRGELDAVYAVATLKSGAKQFEVLEGICDLASPAPGVCARASCGPSSCSVARSTLGAPRAHAQAAGPVRACLGCDAHRRTSCTRANCGQRVAERKEG